MNYEKDQSAESEISYVSEPAVAYAVPGKAAREPWEVDSVYGEDWEDPDAPDADDWLEEALKDPRFLAMIDRDLAQTGADLEAGLCRSHEVVWADLERDIRNGTL